MFKKFLAVAAITICCSLTAFSQGVSFQGPKIESQVPQPIAGLTFNVCLASSSGTPCSPSLTIYSDAALTSPISPALTDGDGMPPNFFIASGQYQWCVSDPVMNRITAYCRKFTAPAGPGGSPSFVNLTITGTLGVSGLSTLSGGVTASSVNGEINAAVQGTGADICAKINSVIANNTQIFVPAPPVPASGWPACAAGIVIPSGTQDLFIRGAGAGATCIQPGFTGAPGASLVSLSGAGATENIVFKDIQFAGSCSGAIPTNTGHMVFINLPGGGNIFFDKVFIGRTKGTGLDLNGASVNSCSIYIANHNGLFVTDSSLVNSKCGVYNDNHGSRGNSTLFFTRVINQGHDTDGMTITTGSTAFVLNVEGGDWSGEGGGGWAINGQAGSQVSGFKWHGVYAEYNQAGHINLNNCVGCSITASQFVENGTINGTALTATEYIKSANFTGTIAGNAFNQASAPGSVTAFVRGVFTGTEIKANTFAIAAGTITNAINLQAAGAGILVGPNFVTGAGTVTAYLNDQITTTTTTDASIPININRSWTVSGGGGGFRQITANTDVAMFTNGNGAVALNVQSGGGTGGVKFGDGAGNTVGTVNSSGLGTFNGGVTTPASLTSTVATGTPPLVVSSTTNVPNLNASTLNGSSFFSQLQAGCNGTATSSVNIFLAVAGSATPACTNTTGAADVNTVMSSAGTIKNLFCSAGTAGHAAGSGVVTIQKNSVSQTVTCTFGTGTSCNDTTHNFTVVAGDLLRTFFTTQATETLANVTCSYEKR
jgi:hypothetical protein